MIRDEAKIIVTPTGVSLKEALIKEVVKALDERADRRSKTFSNFTQI